MEFAKNNALDHVVESGDMTRYRGKLLGIENNVIFGWAYDLNHPDSKLVLEVMLDGYPNSVVVANTFCRDYFEKPFGDNCYGFVSQLPHSLLEIAQKINLRVANTQHILDGDVYLSVPNQKPSTEYQYPIIDSMLVYAGGLKITGHYYDPIPLGSKPKLYFYDNEQLLFSTTLKEKTKQVYKINVELPFSLADGKTHMIQIVDDKKRALKGSPLAVTVYRKGVQHLIDEIVKNSNSELSDSAKNKVRLLENLFVHYNHYLPTSLGFKNYHHWYYSYFDKQQTLPIQSDTSQKKILIIIYGMGNIEKTIKSLNSQQYKNWEAILLDYPSSQKLPKKIRALGGNRFNLKPFLKKNNIAYISVMQAGDSLSRRALNQAMTVFKKNSVEMLYSDIDFDDERENRCNPWFKPNWDYDLYLSQNYINELFIAKSGWVPARFEDKFELLPLYCIRQLQAKFPKQSLADKIYHIAEVLYHKQYQSDILPHKELIPKIEHVIQDMLTLNEPQSRVENHPDTKGLRRIYRPIKGQPLVSIIIPTRDQLKLLKTCISSLMEKTAYKNFEVIIVNNQSTEKKTLKYFKKISCQKAIKVLDYPFQFNYSAINNYAVEQAKGKVIAMVNNDIEFKDPNWLSEMLGILQSDGVGAVGCKLTWPNNMVQHGGVVLGINGLADHAFNHLFKEEPGYFYRAQVTQQYSAVTAACLLTYRKDYKAVQGLDEIQFPVAFNDVDFCLKLGQLGKRVVWTPFVDIVHAESASRGKDNSAEKVARANKEMQNLKRIWTDRLINDPFYNPNLNLDHLSGPFNGLAIPPRNSY